MIPYVSVGADYSGGRTNAIKLHGPAAFEGMRKAGRQTMGGFSALKPAVAAEEAAIDCIANPSFATPWIGAKG